MLYKITDKEISAIVKKAQSTIARWKKENPSLYEAVYHGCLKMKGESNENNN